MPRKERKQSLMQPWWVWLVAFVCLSAHAATFKEDFSRDPTAQGWSIAGDSSLFKWNSTNQNLEAVWDSGRSNSFFYRPLGASLSRRDDFAFSFDLVLEEIRIGVRSDKPFTFQIAIGLINSRAAFQPSFVRGTGAQSPDLVEFDYFPDSGFGATISPVVISSGSQFIPSFNFPLEMTPGDRFRVTLTYRSKDQTLVTAMTRNGQPFGPIKDVNLPASFTDFRVDALAVCNYSDAGAGGSVLARGVVDDFVLTLPEPPVTALTGAFIRGTWQVEFDAAKDWLYTLERTEDFKSWRAVSPVQAGTGGRLSLSDASPQGTSAFYRIRAARP
jgi:hypothetical protein